MKNHEDSNDGDDNNYDEDDLAIVSNSIPEKPKAESPSTHRTRAPGSYFLGKEFDFEIARASKCLDLNLNSIFPWDNCRIELQSCKYWLNLI